MKIKRIDIKGNLYDVEAFINPIPTGSVFTFAGITAPEGFLLCDGSAVSRVAYAKLFGVIGETYGSGDGSTTFNLPNLINRFIEGTKDDIGQTVEAGLPNITGSINSFSPVYSLTWVGAKGEGAFKTIEQSSQAITSAQVTTSNKKGLSFDASRCNTTYGKSDTVQPPAIKMQYIIKA